MSSYDKKSNALKRKAVKCTAVTLGVAAALVIYVAGAIFVVRRYPNFSMSEGAAGLVFTTAAIFGWEIKEKRDRWRKPAFWRTMGVLLIAHLAAWLWVLKLIPQWRVIWFLVTMPLEVVALDTALDWVNEKFPRRKARTSLDGRP